MYKIGLSSCGKKPYTKLFEEFSTNGITEMEISEDYYDEFDYREIYRLSEESGVNLWSLHLPFWYNDISSCDKEQRENALKIYFEIIKKGSDIGIDKFIVHPSFEPVMGDRNEHLKHSRDSLSKLADICERSGSVICAEDLPRSCIGHSAEEMKFLTSDDNRIKICFDTNHITTEKPEDIIRVLADKIVTLHVSDFDFIDERHWLPGEGQINWNAVFEALKQIEYNGVFMYEISYECPETITRGRKLTASDFTRNANELFNGKEFTFPWIMQKRKEER